MGKVEHLLDVLLGCLKGVLRLGARARQTTRLKATTRGA